MTVTVTAAQIGPEHAGRMATFPAGHWGGTRRSRLADAAWVNRDGSILLEFYTGRWDGLHTVVDGRRDSVSVSADALVVVES